MILEIREVSRKTARDGRLEITGETAQRLETRGAPLALLVGDATGSADLEALECHCGKGSAAPGETSPGGAAPGGAPHRHHFVRSPLLMQLAAGESVVLELDADGRLHVARPHALRP